MFNNAGDIPAGASLFLAYLYWGGTQPEAGGSCVTNPGDSAGSAFFLGGVFTASELFPSGGRKPLEVYRIYTLP